MTIQSTRITAGHYRVETGGRVYEVQKETSWGETYWTVYQCHMSSYDATEVAWRDYLVQRTTKTEALAWIEQREVRLAELDRQRLEIEQREREEAVTYDRRVARVREVSESQREAEDARYRAMRSSVFGDTNNEGEAMPTFDTLAGPEDSEMDDGEVECPCCGSVVDIDELVTPEDAWGQRHRRNPHSIHAGRANPYADMVCMDCVSECEDCGEYFRYLSDHQSNWCDTCGEYFCEGVYMSYCDECGNNSCESCGECESCYGGGSIRDYSYRPHSLNFKGNMSEVMMGIELEVEGSERTIVECVHGYDDSENHLYMKHDGSVDGVEIVTHPGTLAWNREQFDWTGLINSMKDEGCHVNLNENGIHVHVSRDSFAKGPAKRSTRHQMSWLMFLYRNSEELQQLARRRAGRWAAFNMPGSGELAEKAASPSRANRYQAVNCNNEATYELRFFAATLKPQEFYAAIEFADASVNYTRTLTSAQVLQGKGMSWSAFITWAEANGYDALVAESNRLVTPTVHSGTRAAMAQLPAASRW